LELLIALATFGAVAFLAFYVLSPRPNDVRRRILAGAANEVVQERTSSGGPTSRLLKPVTRKFGSLLSHLLPQNLVHHIEKLLLHAGEPMTASAFLAIWFFVTGASVLVTFWLVQSVGWGTLQLVLVGGMILFYGSFLPYFLLRRRSSKRRKRVERALPDALDLMLKCVEAGLAVDAAFALVAQRTRGPLAEHLLEYLKQVGLGRSRREALEDIAERSGAASLHRLAAIVAQAGAIGTSMGDVLRIQASELRDIRRLKAREAASKAPIMMTIPLALCFMPAMGAVVVVPSILNLVKHVGELGLGS
jgi:tight adherence protein C